MSINSKKEEKKASKGGVIAAVIILLLSAFEGVEGDSNVFAGIILVVVLFFAVVAIIGAANKAKKNKPAPSAVKTEKKSANKAAKKVDNIPYAQNKQEQKYYSSEKKYYDSDCQKMSSEHDHNRRMEQLDGFLANGIISKAEYDILKMKYMR